MPHLFERRIGMSLRNQPYLPLYVQDFMTDEKLAECSAESTGVYIRLMCLMHKSEEYGKILLKQKDKQKDNQIENFALKLAKHFPYDIETIKRSLEELISENVIKIDGGYLIQKRMVSDNDLSEKRAKAGKKGGLKTKQTINPKKEFASDFAQAKLQANTENEIEYENKDLNCNNLNNLNYETLFFEFWQNYVPVRCDGRFVDKGSKKLSFEKFTKILKSGVKYEDIISGLHAYLNHCRENKQLTCTVPVFLNQQRWADDYNTSTVIAEDTGRKRQEPKSIVETYAEIAAKYAEEDNLY